MKENMNLKQIKLSEIGNLKVHGRTTGERSPLTLFWTGSAIELNVTGTELWIEVEADYTGYEPWISILVNAVPVSRMMVTSGKHWICVFRGMSGNVVKNVRIVKDVQAMNGDPDCYLQIHSVKSDGDFHPVEEKPYKIEFIGDSITSGEGVIGARKEEDWISMWFSAVDNYAVMTANALNADVRIISESGWGVLTSWDNNPHYNIPEYYEKVCGILTGDHNNALGAHSENDFSSWQPDVVVINLGTNDSGAFDNPEWKDEVTGESHKQRMNEDGTLNQEDIRAFEGAVTNFLIKLRRYNQKAHLIWTYGMLGDLMEPAIKRAVDDYRRKSGDSKVSYVELPNTTEETVGARWHPGKLSHEAAARVLVEYIRQLL
jgi:lysophospholipase L1-like esterase